MGYSPLGSYPQRRGDMILRWLGAGALLVSVFATDAQAHVVKFRVERRETILGGKVFGPAGPYEKLVGKVDFALDPRLPINKSIVDLDLAPKNARGEGALMAQGYTLLWMGWQWDVPNGQMRMEMPIATQNGKKITGLVRGNFIPNDNSPTQPLADRNHLAYAIDDPNRPDNVMTVRDRSADKAQVIPRGKWHFVGDSSVALDGGFQMGRIYD